MGKLILVTGVTGAGKTYALKKVDYKHTLYMDDYVKNIFYKKGHLAFKNVVDEFGEEIISNNYIDTKKLGKIVLKSKSKLQRLDEILKQYFINLFKKLKADKNNYLIEMAIYIKHEKWFSEFFDTVILFDSKVTNTDDKFNYLDKKEKYINDDVEIKHDLKVTRENASDKIKKIIQGL